jgi:hypothetical protein
MPFKLRLDVKTSCKGLKIRVSKPLQIAHFGAKKPKITKKRPKNGK